MTLLIDGYNLLHVTGIFGKGPGPGTFQQSREALLRFLAVALGPKLRETTTVVFDATEAPPGLPHTVEFDEMTVRYATGYPDADALIEELIQSESAPRSLLVVSSDHRIQRAARRRRARFVDSNVWYDDLLRRKAQLRATRESVLPEKPTGSLSAREVEHWINEFFSKDTVENNDSCSADETSRQSDSLENLFPPGYGDDLFPGNEHG